MDYRECKVVCSRLGLDSIEYGKIYEAIKVDSADYDEATQFFVINEQGIGEIISGFFFLYYFDNLSFLKGLNWISSEDNTDEKRVIFIPTELRLYKKDSKFVVDYYGGGSKTFNTLGDIELKQALMDKEWLMCRTNPLSHA